MPPAAAGGNKPPGGGRGSVGDRLNNPTPFMRQVGILFLAESQACFREQACDGVPWAPRMVPNIPGILRDLAKGPSVKARRWESKPAVFDTGMLKRSLSVQSQSPLPRMVGSLMQIDVGTTVPYGAKQHDGGPESITITPTMRKNLAILLRRQRGGAKRGKKILGALDRFNRGQSLTVKQRKLLNRTFNRQGKDEDEVRTKFARSSQYDQLGFLFAMDTFDFHVTARRFTNFGARLRSKVMRLGSDFFNGRGGPLGRA